MEKRYLMWPLFAKMWTGKSYPYFMVIFPMSICTLVILSILNSRWNVFYLNDKVMFAGGRSKRKGYNHPKLFKKLFFIKNVT